MANELGFADMTKSGNTTLEAIVVLWDREPLEPITVTVKFPVRVDENVRVEVPVPCALRVMLVGLSVRVGPVGELEAVSAIVPVKLLMLASVIVELAWEPTGVVRLAGLALLVKFGAWLLRNSAIAFAFWSLDVRVARFQLDSIVLVKE